MATPDVFPEVRRFLRRIDAHEDRGGDQEYKVKLFGKRSAIWCSRKEVPEAVYVDGMTTSASDVDYV